jgi:DNA polymerase III delta subunit
MTDKAFDLLMERIKDESVLESELTKLVAFVGEKNTIESKDIRTIVGETHEDSLMALFEAFQKFDKKEMLAIFENLIDNGQYILAIHSYLVNQIRLLLQTKDMEEMVREGVEYPVFAKAFKKWKEDLDLQSSEKRRYLPYQHPYYAYKLSKVGHNISQKDLLAFFEMLTTFDAQVKRGTKYDRVRMEYGLLKV